MKLLPVVAKYNLLSPEKNRTVGGKHPGFEVSMLLERGERMPAYFNEGCSFKFEKDLPGNTIGPVYADLPDQPAGAVKGFYGKGRVALMGFHTEFALPKDAVKFPKKEEGKEDKPVLKEEGKEDKPSDDSVRVQQEKFLTKFLDLD